MSADPFREIAEQLVSTAKTTDPIYGRCFYCGSSKPGKCEKTCAVEKSRRALAKVVST